MEKNNNYPCCCPDSSIVESLRVICLLDTLENHLPDFIRVMTQNPFYSFLFFVLLYLFFLVGAVLYYFVSCIFPPCGSAIIMGLVVREISVGFISQTTFPGQGKFYLRQIEKQYAQRISEGLVMLCAKTVLFCEVLQKIQEQPLPAKNSNGQTFMAFNSLHFERFRVLLPDLKLKRSHIEPLLGGLNHILSGRFTRVKTDETFKQSTSLHKVLSDVCNTLDKLIPNLHVYDWEQLQRFAGSVQGMESIGSLQMSCPALRTIATELNPQQRNESPTASILNIFNTLTRDNSIGIIQLMRQEAIFKWQAKQVAIPVSKDCILDGIYINACGNRDGPISEKGTLIYFNANAELYEMCYDSVWVPFYQNLGYDIFMYNYRGYGSSSGFPHPDALNKDGKVVVDFLKSGPMHVKRIIVHGRSMGGMVACFVGKNCDVAAVIADRTFSQLDAVAERLFAPWTGRAMHFLTNWKNDSVSNFIQTRCPKLLCQSRNDEIIFDPASLQTGVALQRSLGVSVNYGISEQGYEYIIAAALRQPPPHSSAIPQLGIHFSLKESEIMHLYGCLLHISQQAESHSTQTDCPLSHKVVLTNDISPNIATASNLEEYKMHESQTVFEGADKVTQDGRRFFNTEQGGVSERSCYFGKIAWKCLREIKGIHEKTLSQAIASYDEFHAWVCNLIVWGPQLIATSKLVYPTMAVFELGTSLSDLKSLPLQENNSVNHSLIYAISCFEVIESSLVTSSRLGGQQGLGELLQLCCGHNESFHESEKENLVEFLKKHGLLDPVGTGVADHIV